MTRIVQWKHALLALLALAPLACGTAQGDQEREGRAPFELSAEEVGTARGLAEKGQQYAFYLHHSKLVRRQRYHPQFDDYEHTFIIAVPPGDYTLEWVDPESLGIIKSERIKVEGWTTKVTTPRHKLDIAMRLKRV